VTAAAIYTSDGGRSWQRSAVPGGLARLGATSCADGSHCISIGMSPSADPSSAFPYGPADALVSDDGGRSWSTAGRVSSQLLDLKALSCPTAVDCWAAGRVVGQPVGALEVTHDAGATWTSVTLPSLLAGEQSTVTGQMSAGVQAVPSVSCPATGPCMAFASQGEMVGADKDFVLRGGGA